MLRPLFLLLRQNTRYSFRCRVYIRDGKIYDGQYFCFVDDMENGIYSLNSFEMQIKELSPHICIYACDKMETSFEFDDHCQIFPFENGVQSFSNVLMPFANTFKGSDETLNDLYDKRFSEIQNIFNPQESLGKLDMLCDEFTQVLPSIETNVIPTSQLDYMIDIDKLSISQLANQRNFENLMSDQIPVSNIAEESSTVAQAKHPQCMSIEIFSHVVEGIPENPSFSQESVQNYYEAVVGQKENHIIPKKQTRKRKRIQQGYRIPLLSELIADKSKSKKFKLE
eukprot:NODE_35_length_36362_cov_0.944434.p17 type:complete len:282 gc:universal NODE_35_length_36362_cov_0.944434:7429-6584(-)